MSAQRNQERQVVPIVEERLEVRTREVERGRVQVRIRVEDREELAEAVLRQEDVTVERVPVGRPVEAPPPVREEDGVLVVPVLEERLVVRTELILKEELRIVRKSRTEQVRKPVRVRSERVEVTRSEGFRPPLGTESDQG
jgi:stress response protein YsnF